MVPQEQSGLLCSVEPPSLLSLGVHDAGRIQSPLWTWRWRRRRKSCLPGRRSRTKGQGRRAQILPIRPGAIARMPPQQIPVGGQRKHMKRIRAHIACPRTGSNAIAIEISPARPEAIAIQVLGESMIRIPDEESKKTRPPTEDCWTAKRVPPHIGGICISPRNGALGFA